MAKNFIKPRKHETGRAITTKTPYGTTSEMIVTDEKLTSLFTLESSQVLVKDDEGYYYTNVDRVDNGLADPNRYDSALRECVNFTINTSES
jgi:hypothetical protein